MGLGGGWNDKPATKADISQARSIIDTVLSLDINVFDHADIYTFGKAETVFGEALKQAPELKDKMIIQSKCAIRFEDDLGPKRYDFSANHIHTSVEGFELPRYLGKWYEIARFDHSFEEGLSEVTATYSMRDDGGVKVINRGFSVEENAWDEAEGKAYFVESETTGHLKVSFFGPFYASYVIMELDKEGYQYALITGPDKDYLWILARTPSISDEVRTRLLEKATSAGYDVSKLIWVEHGEENS
jgi:apolipoprotein D and lipocalin family protein